MSGTPNIPIISKSEKIAPQITTGTSQAQNITLVSRLAPNSAINTSHTTVSGIVPNSSVVVIRSLTNVTTSGILTGPSSGGLKITPVVPLKISSLHSTSLSQTHSLTTTQLLGSNSTSSPLRTSTIISQSCNRSQTLRPGIIVSSGSSLKPKVLPAPTNEQQSTNQRNVIREMQVRVPNKRDKRFSVLRFHTADRLDLSSGPEVFLQRENNLKSYRSLHRIGDSSDRGAGSEFGREAKEEARLKKYGIIRESYKPDDQPWLMTVGKGKTGSRRFRGIREGSVSENVEYFIFCQCKDGNFDAYPVHAWYKMKPEINYRFLKEDEAEAEYSRLNKTLNLFNVMVKRKLTSNPNDEEETMMDREINKGLRYLSSVGGDNSTNTSKQKGSKSERDLKLTDLEEFDSDSEADEDDDDEFDEVGAADNELDNTNKSELDKNVASSSGVGNDSLNRLKNSLFGPIDSLSDDNRKLNTKTGQLKASDRQKLLRKKQRAAAIVKRMRRGPKKRKRKALVNSSSEEDNSFDEAQDDSEVDDHEGDEVDYMTNSSSDEEKLSSEERDKIYEETGVDEEVALKTLLTDISSDEEDNSNPKLSNLENALDNPLIDDEQDDLRYGGRKMVGDHLSNHGGFDNGDNYKSSSSSMQCRRKKSHHTHNLNKNKDGDETGLSSSSSSSSADDDSSTYSSSNSDSDLDPDIQFQKSMQKSAKKAELFQKLSDSIHISSLANTSLATLETTTLLTTNSPMNIVRNMTYPSTNSDDIIYSTNNSIPTINSTGNNNNAVTVAAASSTHTNSSTNNSILKRRFTDSSDQASHSDSNFIPSVASTSLISGSKRPRTNLSNLSAPSGTNTELFDTVRKYLMRKPITVRELLKKIRLRKLVGKNEDAQTVLASVLRQLRPIKQTINGQHVLSLKQ